jgi:hypothetical protein
MRTRLTLAIVAMGMALAGCGSDEEGKPIPEEVAADIDLLLDKIQGQIDQGSLGACNDIKKPDQTFEALQAAVERVPSSVDADVRDALGQSVERLSDLIDEECSSREPETTTEPEQTETVTIETVPEETVPEETVPEETVPDEEEDDGEGAPEDTPGLGPPEGGTGPPSGGGGGSGGVPAPGGGE